MRAKKSLGQNFLQSKSAIQKIIEAGNLVAGETVLEIGPGTGNLTSALLAAGAKIFAVETDVEMCAILEEKFKNEIADGQLKIIHQDIREFDPDNINYEYKLIANIPYYITGEIIRKFLSTKNQPTHAVLLVQKEVAERIVAKDKKESLLSISVKAYCEPEIAGIVKAGSFVPTPKVDSAIIAFKNISKKLFTHNHINEEKFFEVVRTGFAHKRKTLLSNLKNYKTSPGQADAQKIIKLLQNLSFDKNVRAENVNIKEWFELTKNIS